MRQVSTAISTALLGSRQTRFVELWTFYFASGTKRWTSTPFDITYGGNTWVHGEAVFKKGMLFAKLGTDSDSLEVRLAGSVTIGGASLTAAACGYTFDGIRVVLERLVYASDGSPAGTFSVFDGTVLGVRPETTELVLEVKSALAAKGDGLGTRVVQDTCPFDVYDTSCGATVQESGATVAAGSTTKQLNLASVPAVAVPGSLVQITSGALAGIRVLVRSVGAGYVVVDRALPSAPAAGVAVTIRRGCDKSRATCRTVFSNIARHGGAPERPGKSLTYG